MQDHNYDPTDGFFAALNDENDFERDFDAETEFPLYEDYDNVPD